MDTELARAGPVLLGFPKLQRPSPPETVLVPSRAGGCLQTRGGLSRGQPGPRDPHAAEPWAAGSTQAWPQAPREGDAVVFQALAGSPCPWNGSLLETLVQGEPEQITISE